MSQETPKTEFELIEDLVAEIKRLNDSLGMVTDAMEGLRGGMSRALDDCYKMPNFD